MKKAADRTERGSAPPADLGRRGSWRPPDPLGEPALDATGEGRGRSTPRFEGRHVGAGDAQVLREARGHRRPLVVCVQKADRGVDVARITDELNAHTDRTPVWLYLPFDEDGSLVGVVDVLAREDEREERSQNLALRIAA